MLGAIAYLMSVYCVVDKRPGDAPSVERKCDLPIRMSENS